MSYRGLLLAGAMGAGLTAGAVSARAADLPRLQLDVPAGLASSSLTEFARQADVQVLAPAAMLQGLHTGALRGLYSPRQGLLRLLQGTSLLIGSETGSTFVIRSVDRQVPSSTLIRAAAPATIQIAQASPPANPAVVAPSGSVGSTGLGEVVVTARKTTENLQKAPASIVAVSGTELDREGITDAQSLEKVMASVNLRQEGAVVQTFIRGVGSRSDTPNFSAAAAFLFNGIVIPRYGTGGLLFDLASVQQIAGPQGTLYGGSAAGGAINLNAVLPRGDYAGSLSAEAGNYNRTHLAATQNLPLGDKLSLRGAVDYDRRHGYESFGIDAQDRLEERLSLLAKPSDNLTALVFFSGARDTGKPATAFNNNPFAFPSDHFRLPATGGRGNPISSGLTFRDNGANLLGANIEWRIAGNVFTYIPALVSVADDYVFYINGGNQLQVHNDENQYTNELRWNRDAGAFKFSAGVFSLHNKTSLNDSINIATGPTLTFLNSKVNNTKQVNKSFAVYGQVVYAATERLRLTVGARSTRDIIHATGSSAVAGAYVPFSFDKSKTQPDWKVGVDYDLAPRVLVYANVQTSYIPFGYNPIPSKPGIDNTVPESRLTAYSGGVKSRFLDDKLEINDELFYYDYRDYQAVAFNSVTQLPSVFPAKKSTIYGDEITLRALLPADTEFDASALLQSARFDDFVGVGFNYSGNEFVNAPNFNLQAGLQHDVGLGSAGDLLARVATHYESGHYGDYTNFASVHQKAYFKTDISLTYTPSGGRWRAQAYVRNLENRAVFGTLALGSTPTAPGTGTLEPPRTFGLRLSAQWN
jgi:iron complex outermembrane receptor protein